MILDSTSDIFVVNIRAVQQDTQVEKRDNPELPPVSGIIGEQRAIYPFIVPFEHWLVRK